MKGLLLKEWYVIRANYLFMIVVSVLTICTAVFTKSAFRLNYITMLFGMLPFSMIAYDENCRWQQYAFACPYSRKMIVSAKYLATLLLTLGSLIVSGVLFCIIAVNADSFSVSDLCVWMICTLSAGLLMPMIMLPLTFLFGTAKAKIVWIVLMTFSFSVIGGALGDREIANVFANGTLVCAAMLLGIAVLTAVSWLISVSIYERKDF